MHTSLLCNDVRRSTPTSCIIISPICITACAGPLVKQLLCFLAVNSLTRSHFSGAVLANISCGDVNHIEKMSKRVSSRRQTRNHINKQKYNRTKYKKDTMRRTIKKKGERREDDPIRLEYDFPRGPKCPTTQSFFTPECPLR